MKFQFLSRGGFSVFIALSLLLSTTSLKAQSIVTGKVLDSLGQPLRGVSVLIKGSRSGTSTAPDGSFRITASSSSTLVFTNTGYLDHEEALNNRTSVNVNLVRTQQNLDEVVVTGYSRQSKRDITGAVSTISSDIIAKTPVPDVGSALQGRVAGVSVDAQAGPGSTSVIRIRGFGTNGNNTPLYVVDGVQMRGDNNLLNSNDIESVTILKDPSLTSLYGAQGGNGVIVITTKSGKNGLPKFEYSAYGSYENPIKYPRSLSPQNYADAYWGYLRNSGLPQTDLFYGSGPTPVLPAYIIERENGGVLVVGDGSSAADISNYNISTYRILKTNPSGTDWFKEAIRPAYSQNHQVSLSGASDRSNYSMSLNYLENKGLLIGTDFKRYSMRVNTEFKPTPWLKLGESFLFSFSQGATFTTSNNHNPNNILSELYKRSPLIPVYDIAGNYSGPKGLPVSISLLAGSNNPIFAQRSGRANSNGFNSGVIGSAYVDIEPIKGVTIESKIGLQFYPYSYRGFSDTMPQNLYVSPYNSFSEGSGWSTDWRWTNKISYDLNINQEHKITAFVAYETRRFTARNQSGTTPNLAYTVPGFQNLGNGAPIQGTGPFNVLGGYSDGATAVSQFGNLTYGYKEKYLFSYVIRRDGSSRFGPLSKYGVFPSYSAGWRISQENFMDKLTWLNDLKLRAALGSNGNDAIPSGLYLNQFNTAPGYNSYDLGGTNNTAVTGVGLYQVGNPSIHWETNKTTNIGFDASLFGNKLTASFSWFDRITKDLLGVPPVTGLLGDALSPYKNVMKFSNRGVELEMGFNNNVGKLRYELAFNISTYRNKVLYINGSDNDFIDGAGFGTTHLTVTRSIVGKPVSSFLGYEQIGIFQDAKDYQDNGVAHFGLSDQTAAGHFKFRDLNGDKVINDADRTLIGSPHPDFMYGFNLNLYYGDFDMNVFFQGVQGNKILNYWRVYTTWPGALGEGSLDTWSPENTDAKLPIWNNTSSQDLNPSSFFVEDGSYLRLKSLQLGYTIPQSRAFKKLRVYVQGYNLLTFTKYTGIDPEISSGDPSIAGVDQGGNYPFATKYLIGVNFGL